MAERVEARKPHFFMVQQAYASTASTIASAMMNPK